MRRAALAVAGAVVAVVGLVVVIGAVAALIPSRPAPTPAPAPVVLPEPTEVPTAGAAPNAQPRVTVYDLPDGWRDVAAFCDGHGHRVYLTRGDMRMNVIADGTCPGGR